jgi:hypothetical protein
VYDKNPYVIILLMAKITWVLSFGIALLCDSLRVGKRAIQSRKKMLLLLDLIHDACSLNKKAEEYQSIFPGKVLEKRWNYAPLFQITHSTLQPYPV